MNPRDSYAGRGGGGGRGRGGGRGGFRGGRESNPIGSDGRGGFSEGRVSNPVGRGSGLRHDHKPVRNADLGERRNVERGVEGFQGRGRGERRNGEGRREYIQKEMGYGRLKTWSEMEDAGELVLFMSSEKKQIETFLNQSSIKPDWMTLFVKSVSHAVTAQHQGESIRQLLHCLCNARFFENLANYVTEKGLGYAWTDAEEFYKCSVRILEEILNKLPEYAIKCVTCTSSLLNEVPRAGSVRNNEVLVDEITILSKRSKEVYMEEKEKERRPKGGRFGVTDDSNQPPDNFETLSVVPTEADLLEDAKPFVRSAKKEGGYENVNHYLDVQFRLMRQDFVHPLREGIAEFKKNGSKKNFNCSDLRMYYDVHIVGTVFKDGIDHILQFDVSNMKNVKWELSKRLIFGSLLCLSKDNFKTVLFATVSHRDAKDLAKGIVSVNFRTGLECVFISTSNDVYVMAETTAYYESYCHVLEGLKEMAKVLPLQDYIVSCKKELRPPRYLLPSGGNPVLPMYDLHPLMKNEDINDEVPVLTTTRWPTADAMCLNESQREAAQMALTKELAIIQGPPGTGKTYVGLKVMNVLLENMHVVSGSEKKNDPILVVCYTNHALDQFLEGLLQFCPEGIVRVGGKNSSEKLERFNIKNLKEKVRKEKLFSNLSVRKSIYDVIQELKLISGEIEKLKEKLENAEIDVLPEKILENFIKPQHFISLNHDSSYVVKGKEPLKVWLNTSRNSPRSLMPKMINKHLTMLILKWSNPSMNLRLTDDMDIIQRASYYHTYLNMYIQNAYQEMQFVANQPPYFKYNPQVIMIQNWLTHAHSMILPDEELERVIPEGDLRFMFKTSKDSHVGVVESWLLGINKGMHSQLDDVQRLTDLMSGEMAETETFDDDDASKQAQNSRIIDDDDDDDNYGIKNKNAMNSMASVIHRAGQLGIQENILTEDGSEEDDDDGFQTVSRKKKLTIKKLQNKLRSIKPMTEEKEGQINSIWDLKPDERFSLYNLWISRYKETLAETMQVHVAQYKLAFERKKEINREEILFLLRAAKVIGMTTTGAAKHRAVLQAVGCKIIVVEEAAEVLESHIVTALNKNCNHLILIGDHQQLRPSPTVYLLAKEYNLEISLFERLINNKVPHVLLKEQHRMRPEISNIMRHIYPDLEDHGSVKEYDSILGVTKNIFFIQHEHLELHVDDSRSKANIHEAKFLVALCQYLLYQGYKESQITILATYAGQVFAIRKTMKDIKFTSKVRVTAVDNFQGEENDIILLSLVRSNTENNVGFLKVDNRVCVALSRAKKGLFVIGNFELLSSQSKLWKNIVETAKHQHIIGPGLPVKCQNHSDFQQIITTDEDFDKCPDGGCGRPCEYRLECGHVCARKCHGYDLEHKDYECKKPCGRKCKDGHQCKKKCNQNCGDCMVPVLKIITICGHEDMVACSVPETKAECSQECNAVLDCEHICSGKCGLCKKAGEHKDCIVPMTYSWPCGHSATVPCFMKPSAHTCQKVCGAILECGHKCIGKCADCLEGAVHVVCGEKCDKSLPCGHTCSSRCGVPCLPCTVKCPAQCRHGACYKQKPPPLCGHACPSCKEICKQGCSHVKCKKMCSDVCELEPCKKRCQKKLKCTHKCSGLCGELCVCDQCDKIISLNNTKKQEKVLAKSEQENETNFEASSEDVDNTSNDNQIQKNSPSNSNIGNEKQRLIIKIPTCSHIFYVDELDEYVSKFDPQGTSYIFCPSCQRPIMKCSRYENNNRERSVKREAEKFKLQMKSNISKRQKTDLQKSQKLLDDSLLMSGFHSIDLAEVKNLVHLQAMSFKLKCAFMLSEISSIMDKNPTPSQFLKSRKDAVLKMCDRLTAQQKSEFSTELMRCFWLSYLTHLENLCRYHGINVPTDTKTTMDMTIKALNKLKPSELVLERSKKLCSIVLRLISEGTTEDVIKAQCLLLEKASIRAIKVMESRDEEMLCDLLESATRSSASSSDMRKMSSRPPASRFGLKPPRENSRLRETKQMTSRLQRLLLDTSGASKLSAGASIPQESHLSSDSDLEEAKYHNFHLSSDSDSDFEL